jgi:tetratricopeptide (TPR) repeat protein
MSAFFSALAVMFIYLLIWELSRRADPDSGWLAHVGGVVGAFFLAFSETFWNSAIEAEVYGLSAFMLAILSWLAVRWYDNREQAGSNNLLLLMIYLLGLGVGFHLGSLLVYPGVFVIVLLASRRQLPTFDLFLMSAGLAVFLYSTTTKNNTAVLLILAVYLLVVMARSFQGHHFALLGSALFFVGLTVHVMMLIRAGASPPPFINQTQPDNFSTLLEVIRREQYPPMNPFERRAPLDWQFGYYYRFLFKQFYFLGPGYGTLTAVTTVLGPIFLALVGLFQGLRRLFPLVLLPLVNYLINGEILTLYLNFTDHEVRDRDYFYFAAFMFFAVFIGMGASALLRYAAGGEGKSAEQARAAGIDWRTAIPRVKVGPTALVAAAVLLVISLWPLTPGHTKYFEHDNSENRIAYEYAWNILAGLDENAIIFTNGDNDTFPIWYLQEVEKFRRDVTVVNLSLVNLPWYIKQLKYDPVKPLALTRNDREIDGLRHRIYEDPKTGERTVLMIKDYVVHDIITTNHAGAQRPVFFAVTIPTENMSRYVPNLQMEGMAYRLLETTGPDDLPVVDPQKVLENMLGVYRVGSLMDGDTPERQRRYMAMAGYASDQGGLVLGRPGRTIGLAELDTLARMYGNPRDDIYRNTNARHLLGNYPAALNRAGYEFFVRASSAGVADTLEYRQNLDAAMLAFRTSLQVAPFNDLALEYYPLLLIQAYRDQEAKEFLDSMAGNVPVETEERILYNTMKALVQGGEADLALSWIGERLAAHPDRMFFYQLKFHIYQALGRWNEAAAVLEDYETRTGERPPEMERALEEMRQRALEREQQRIEGAVGGEDGQ